MATMNGYDDGVFCWVDLATPDLAAAVEFYGGLFGWTPDAQPSERGGYTIFLLDGAPVAGVGEHEPGYQSAWNNYVKVDDIEAVAARAEALGAEVVFPVQDAMGAGRLAYFRGPEGETFALWEPRGHRGAGRVNEPGCLAWNELCGQDLPKLQTFYAELFGWRFEDMEGYRVIRCGERPNGGLLQIAPEWGPHPSCWTPYFNVTDLAAAVARVKALGGSCEVEAIDTPGGKASVVKDPWGAAFELIQLNEWD